MALLGSALSGARFPGAPLNRANVGRGPMAGGGGPMNGVPVDVSHGFKNPAGAIHGLMGNFAPSQPSLAHLLAAAAGAHPRPQHQPGAEQPGSSFLAPQAGNYAQLEPLIQAILGHVGNPNLRY